jgi:hypothetical protein
MLVCRGNKGVPPPGDRSAPEQILLRRPAVNQNCHWFYSTAGRQTRTGIGSSLPPGGRKE